MVPSAPKAKEEGVPAGGGDHVKAVVHGLSGEFLKRLAFGGLAQLTAAVAFADGPADDVEQVRVPLAGAGVGDHADAARAVGTRCGLVRSRPVRSGGGLGHQGHVRSWPLSVVVAVQRTVP